jgi:SAM-dependent methyltransferase
VTYHEPAYQEPGWWPVSRRLAETVLAVRALVPEGGHVLDVGTGAATTARHLARVRPDIRVTALGASRAAGAAAHRAVVDGNLEARVQVRLGDVTDPAACPDADRVDLVTCVFLLHHLPDRAALDRLVASLATVRERTGAALWLHDTTRLVGRARETPAVDALERLGEHEVGSEARGCVRSSWTFREVRVAARPLGRKIVSTRGGPGRPVHSHCVPGLHAPAPGPPAPATDRPDQACGAGRA